MKYNLPKGRLSYSGMNTFMACPRKYAYRYIDNIEQAESDTSAMDRGSLFHTFAEHDGKVSEAEVKDIVEDPFEIVRVTSAFKQYKAAEDKGLFPKMKHKEVKIASEEHQFLGYIDSVGVKPDGQWYLGELKTTARLDATQWLTKAINMQTSLYSAMAYSFAHDNWLTKDDFQGVSFRTVEFSGKRPLKPTKTRKEPETLEDYAARIEGEAKIHHQIIKPEDYQEDEALRTFTYVKERIHSLGGDSGRAPKNTSSCFMYNKPCEYFEHCHGINPNLEDTAGGTTSGIDYDE